MFFFCRWKCVTIPQLLPFQHKCDINLTHLLPSRSSLFISNEKICWGSGGFITHSRALPSKLPTICTIAPCRQWCSNCFHLLMKSCRSLNLRLLEEGPGKEPRRVWKVNKIHNVFKYVIISHEHNRTFCACIGDILYQNIHPTMTSSNTPRYILCLRHWAPFPISPTWAVMGAQQYSLHTNFETAWHLWRSYTCTWLLALPVIIPISYPISELYRNPHRHTHL